MIMENNEVPEDAPTEREGLGVKGRKRGKREKEKERKKKKKRRSRMPLLQTSKLHMVTSAMLAQVMSNEMMISQDIRDEKGKL